MPSKEDQFLAGKLNAYMRACVDGEALIRRWRLMVLGPSGDGKTSLISRLLGKGFTKEHVVTNALETDCKVEIHQCDRMWQEYKEDHLDLLQQGVQQGITQYIKRENASNTDNQVMFDEIKKEEQEEAMKMLKGIFSESEPGESKDEVGNGLKSFFNKMLRKKSHEGSVQIEKPEFLRFILSIWDLGGQVLYYALHHLFLRLHCVYILVVNLSRPLHSLVPSHELPPHARKQSMEYYQSIEFWLNMVFSHMTKINGNAEFPRILLVGTHKDLLHENPKEQERLAQKYFGELQILFLNKAHFQQVHSEFIAVDSKNGDPKAYSKLRAKIFELVEKHCKESRPRPIRWLRLEKKLHELKNDPSFINPDQYLVDYERVKEYAKDCRIETTEDLNLFLEHHHLSADITYCSGDGLGDFIIPHPQWLVDVLRSLITMYQFYPQSQKCFQGKNQLQREGLLKTNGPLLEQVWGRFLNDDNSAITKKYLLKLMTEFHLAVKYEEDQYIIPCLLPLSPSKGLPVFESLIRNLPALYYMFHSSLDSYADVTRGLQAYDNFLPHGLFQKLVAKCSKQGWAWTKDRYQDSVSFTTDDVLISLHIGSTWIEFNAYVLDQGISVNYGRYQSIIADSIKQLLSQYHPNMWFEVAVNPCAKLNKECPLSIGLDSFSEGHALPHGVTCTEHICSLATPEFKMWFSSNPCRSLTEKDLKRVCNDITTENVQYLVGNELNVPLNEIEAINRTNHEIKMASFRILKYWYDQQVYKVEAFSTLCNALTKAGQAGIVGSILNALKRHSSRNPSRP